MTAMRNLICLFTAALAFQSPSVTPTANEPAIFHDSALQFSFEYPSNLGVNREAGPQSVDKTRQTTEGDVKRAAECLTSPLVAVENAGTQNFGFVMVTESDFNCEDKSVNLINADILSSLTQTALQTAMNMLGEAHIDRPASYRAAGHLASVVEGKVDAATSKSKADIFGESACVVIRQDVVCFNAMSANKTRLRQLLGGNILFDGGPKSPLVPVSILAP